MKSTLVALLLLARAATSETRNTVGNTVASSRPVYFSTGSTLPPIIIPKNYTTRVINNETVYEHVYANHVQGKQKFGVRQALRQGAGAMSALLNTVSGGLAAVGGGFLLYATMLGMFGENFLSGVPGFPSSPSSFGPGGGLAAGGPFAGFPSALPDAPDQNLDHGFPGVTGYLPIQKRIGEQLFTPRRRSQLRAEDVKTLRQAMKPFMSTLRSLREVDYLEHMFRVLHVQDLGCKQRTICEIEQYLSGQGIGGYILHFLSPQIPGMDKYHNAISAALRHQNCGAVFRSCPETIGQRLLKLIGVP